MELFAAMSQIVGWSAMPDTDALDGNEKDNERYSPSCSEDGVFPHFSESTGSIRGRMNSVRVE
jgi:hypothetical protein